MRRPRQVAPVNRKPKYSKPTLPSESLRGTGPAADSNAKWDEVGDEWLLMKAQNLINDNGFPDYDSFARKYRAIAQQISLRPDVYPEDLDFPKKTVADKVVEAGSGAPEKKAEPKRIKSLAPTKAKERSDRWEDLEDDELLERAQEIIEAKGFTDYVSFAKTYRAIAHEVAERPTLCPADLEFNDKPAIKEEPSTFRWEDISDDEVLERAQRAFEREGFPDVTEFTEKYRGIRYQLFLRSLGPESLSFPRP
jgi:hypothetical protein